MAGRRPGRFAAALVAAVVTALVTGCQGDDGDPAASPAESASTTWTPAGDCLELERRIARSIWFWQAVDQVTGSPTGTSVPARRAVERSLARATRRLLERCDGRLPPTFDRFATDVEAATRGDRFGGDELDQVLAAWLRWSTSMGVPQVADRQIEELEACRKDFFPRFDASYRTWWEPTPTGRAWWVEITFDNRTGKQLTGSMWGAARVTRMLKEPYGVATGPRPGPGRNATLHWGGSSADILVLRRGTTVQGVAPDADLDVHTTDDGTFRVTEMQVGLQPLGERYACSPPVHPRS